MFFTSHLSINTLPTIYNIYILLFGVIFTLKSKQIFGQSVTKAMYIQIIVTLFCQFPFSLQY